MPHVVNRIATELIAAAKALSRAVDALDFHEPVVAVYNPLDYAFEGYRAYVERFAHAPNDVVMVGMNPGPFGMAQTGVPFGEVSAVRDWMKIDARIRKPKAEHAKRPVDGLQCLRSEVSGARLWGAIAAKFAAPEQFFARHFVINYCPLLFLEDSGRNRTPDKLPRNERAPLERACDAHLERALSALRPKLVLGVGGWAEKRVRAVVDDKVPVACLPHPSPASPQANAGWSKIARAKLLALGVEPFV
jgi:single-strand selective monofunctional uracil DNA glycosylase